MFHGISKLEDLMMIFQILSNPEAETLASVNGKKDGLLEAINKEITHYENKWQNLLVNKRKWVISTLSEENQEVYRQINALQTKLHHTRLKDWTDRQKNIDSLSKTIVQSIMSSEEGSRTEEAIEESGKKITHFVNTVITKPNAELQKSEIQLVVLIENFPRWVDDETLTVTTNTLFLLHTLKHSLFKV